MLTIGVFPGIMLGVELFTDEEYGEKTLIIDLFFIRILFEF